MKCYSYKFANDRHNPIHTVGELKAAGYQASCLGFYFNGKSIGVGDLIPTQGNAVHTESVRLDKGYRRKGHGIHLYLALIRAAKKIGAARIYSSRRLNRYSRRMWSEKLPALFEVKQSRTRRKCHRCGHKNLTLRYYIDLR